jgi:hypothetical protein
VASERHSTGPELSVTTVPRDGQVVPTTVSWTSVDVVVVLTSSQELSGPGETALL